MTGWSTGTWKEPLKISPKRWNIFPDWLKKEPPMPPIIPIRVLVVKIDNEILCTVSFICLLCDMPGRRALAQKPPARQLFSGSGCPGFALIVPDYLSPHVYQFSIFADMSCGGWAGGQQQAAREEASFPRAEPQLPLRGARGPFRGARRKPAESN